MRGSDINIYIFLTLQVIKCMLSYFFSVPDVSYLTHIYNFMDSCYLSSHIYFASRQYFVYSSTFLCIGAHRILIIFLLHNIINFYFLIDLSILRLTADLQWIVHQTCWGERKIGLVMGLVAVFAFSLQIQLYIFSTVLRIMRK